MTTRRHKADKCDAFSESRTGHSALAMCRRMTRARCRPCVARCRRRLPLLHAPHTRRTLCATHRALPIAKYPPHAMRHAPRTIRRAPCAARPCATRRALRSARRVPCSRALCIAHRTPYAVCRAAERPNFGHETALWHARRLFSPLFIAQKETATEKHQVAGSP